MSGSTLQNLHVERKAPLTPRSIFPNVLHSIITVGFRAPAREPYMICFNTTSQSIRMSPGPPVFIISATETVDIRMDIAMALEPYVQDSVARRNVTAYESYIPMNPEEEPSIVEFSVRDRYHLDAETNAIQFTESSVSDMMQFVKDRAVYVHTWQGIERHLQDFSVLRDEPFMTSRGNTTMYTVHVDTDGRLSIGYHIKKDDSVPATRQVAVCSTVEFQSRITSPSVLYDTETYISYRLGVFSGTHRIFDSMNDSLPSHIEWMPDPPEAQQVRDDATLHEYQRDGVKAMIRHESMPDGLIGLFAARISGQPGHPGIFQVRGKQYYIDHGFGMSAGMLCDDTGMGKTRQISALIRHTRHRDRGATLIIVPPSIVYQWTAEIKATWPGVRLLLLYGRSRSGIDLDRDVPAADVAITTYSTFTKYMHDLAGITWSRVVFDEAHTIPRSFGGCIDLRRQHTWLVTATPDVQTHRILRMVDATLPRTVRVVCDPLQFHEHTSDAKERMWRIFRPLVIRRTRERHLHIPDVIRRDVEITLSDNETEMYRDEVNAIQNMPVNRYYNSLLAMNAIRALQHMASTGRQILLRTLPTDRTDTWFHPESRVPLADVPADDPCPICIGPMDEPSKTVCNHWFCKECIGNAMIRNNRCPMCRATIDPGTIFVAEPETAPPEPETPRPQQELVSTKMTTITRDVVKILEDEPDDRILVFFETRAMLDVYAEHLKKQRIMHTAIHGGVSVSTRSRRISEFQYSHDSPYRVLLLTTKTASAGITLTRANHIILCSPTIPRELETQMIGRSHRLGQSKPVYFTRYIAKNTIEEYVSHSDMTARDAGGVIMNHIHFRQ